MNKPAFKRPILKGPKLTTPEAPAFIKDLYADLRDRHLLLPVAALIVAIAAVPLLLGGGSSEVSPTPPLTSAGSGEALQIAPAVLAEVPGIRNYRERLAALRKQNPFDQQFSGSKPGQESTVAVDDGSAAVSVAGEGGGSQAVIPTSGSTPAPASEPVSQSSDAAVSTGAEPDTGGRGSSESIPAEEARFYTGTVDVSFGALGSAKRYKNVKRFTSLPNDKESVVAFLGLSVDSERAYFLVSPAVTGMNGDGVCPGVGSECEFLELAIGEQQTLTVGGAEPAAPRASATASAADGTETAPASAESPSPERQVPALQYRLKLLDTNLVEISDPGDE